MEAIAEKRLTAVYRTTLNPCSTNPRPAARYDMAILGGGPAGLLAAHAAVAEGAKVALIERNLLGGVCVNVGCISSKSLICTSRLYAEMRDAQNYGARIPGDIEVDFPRAMSRMRAVRARLRRRVLARTLASPRIDLFFGEGAFAGPDAITVAGEKLFFKTACIATGARPLIPPIPGLSVAGYLTNESVFDLNECPPRLLVIGGGPLGCELAQAFCRLGSRVTIVQDEPLFLSQEERDAAQILSEALARDGIDIHLNTQTVQVETDGSEKVAHLERDGDTATVAADEILIGAGSVPNAGGLHLETAGVDGDETNGIRVNDFLQTTNPRIYASGDVCSVHKFAHIEGVSARIVVQNALRRRRERLSEVVIPWCTYTDPEIAHTGMYVTEARAKKIPVKTFTVPMHDVDRAVIDGEEEGFVKIHVKEGTDRILGATVVARHAGEIINDISLAIMSRVGLSTVARISHPYPTQAAAIRMAAEMCASQRRDSIFKRLLRRVSGR